MANKIQVLWADDEIDLLKPYILYLEDKGYEVIPVCSGNEAIDVLNERLVDIVFVDEKLNLAESEPEDIAKLAVAGIPSDYIMNRLPKNSVLITSGDWENMG